MKRLIYTIGLCVALLLSSQQRASAQFATFDASNLAQAILAFLQDGDNMVLNTEQFLQNLGVAKEQLEFLQEMDKRYKEVRSDLWKAQSVIRMAQNYEQMDRMFTRYVERVKDMNGKQITYYQGRSMVNEGFQYLLYASREVKRAREYLDSKSQVSEEERMAQLAECDRRLSRANAAMYNHIKETYVDIDRGERLAEACESLEESFKINW
jgi:macrodomain Ter protein organizer (MatP/YcbG family)